MRHTLRALAATATLALPAAAQQRVDPSAPDSAAVGAMAQATTTPAATRQPMDEGRIRDHLRGLGYTDLDGVERRGDAFHIREARRGASGWRI